MQPLLKSVRTKSEYTGFHRGDAEVFAKKIRASGGRAEISPATSCAAGGTEHWGFHVRYQTAKAIDRFRTEREVLRLWRMGAL